MINDIIAEENGIELIKPDNKTYQGRIAGVNAGINEEVGNISKENAQLLLTKVDIYNDNADILGKYVDSLKNDKKYENTISKLKTEQKKNVDDNGKYLKTFAGLLTNSKEKGGVPNKNFYDFVSNPILIVDAFGNELTSIDQKMGIDPKVYWLLGITIGLGGIILGSNYLKRRREDREDEY